ncbi:hypothetical protein [Halalkalibacterium halodurans]|uniref:Uncharacterized protein n=1 Tax=Halalkalibacterium halodurans TaxID=86665 RepID=A0A0M0KJA9_ALKHA|nr:hypothetical protein [Halalkalibacterium halodurans]TPE65930.1 hypothetical protein AMD02_019900 [Halalkalibacterium halodurans]
MEITIHSISKSHEELGTDHHEFYFYRETGVYEVCATARFDSCSIEQGTFRFKYPIEDFKQAEEAVKRVLNPKLQQAT